MRFFGISEKGLVRRENQDCFSIEDVRSRSLIIAALCDGMGGHAAGKLAGQVANSTFVGYVRARLTSRTDRHPDVRTVLLKACSEANEAVLQYSALSEEYRGLGTTLVGAVIYDSGKMEIVNIGDSRAYLISGKKRAISQITKDHSLVERYVESGLITREEARVHPKKNIITRALGGDSSVQGDLFEAELNDEDMLLLCSDGLSNFVTDQEMLDFYLIDREPEHFCENLLKLTYERGAGDNVTIVSVVNE